jgi:DNA-binding CsgD family transcriptional regulator
MSTQIQKLHDVWVNYRNKSEQNTDLPQITLEDLSNAITSTGPFYFYVIDFADMSLSHISPSIYDIHNFEQGKVTFDDILNTLHPNDIDFLSKTEASIAKFFYENIGQEKFLHYKINYCFRLKMKNGEYALINHQALMLTLDKSGGYGKVLNIHTRIDHITKSNNYQFSLIGLNGEPSYMNLNNQTVFEKEAAFSKREIEILKLISNGNNNNEIADKLCISQLTVKKHRKNILQKANCKNTTQLIKNCVLQGLI